MVHASTSQQGGLAIPTQIYVYVSLFPTSPFVVAETENKYLINHALAFQTLLDSSKKNH